MMNTVYERMYKQIQDANSDPFNNNCFALDQNIIEKQLSTWEQSITVSTNRSFNQFMIINNPVKKIKNCFNTVYVNGSLFQAKEDAANRTANAINPNVSQKVRSFEVPLYQKLPSKPDGIIIRAGRNNFVKDEMFYEQVANGRTKPFCLRLDEKDASNRVKQVKLDISNFRSQPDCMVNYNKNFKEGIFVDVF